MRARWSAWMAAEEYTFTAGGNMRAPDLLTLAQWVKDLWADIKVPMVVKSFKVCCISNSLDGTEDDIVWDWRQQEKKSGQYRPVQTDPHSDVDVLTEQDMALLDAHDIADGDDMSDSE